MQRRWRARYSPAMSTTRTLTLLAAAAVALVAVAPVDTTAAPDAAVGACTRKNEFAKRQADLDEKVVALGAETDPKKRAKLVKALVKSADRDLENLLRYREPHMADVFAGVLAGSKKWFQRSRAAYGLKMVGGDAHVASLAAALADSDGLVRESAATALGHLRGDAAAAALSERLAKEEDAYVRATIEASLALLAKSEPPYGERPDGKRWSEALDGPDGARRVRWDWVVKGEKLFNDYDARAVEHPVAERFVHPVQRYEEDLFAGYPRNSFGAGGNHAGEDCAWFRDGCSYYAIADGVVRMVQGAGGDWGFLVAIEHRLADGRMLTSVYGHAGFDILVKPGDVVRCGQKVATQGLSCSVENGGYGAHLHFGLGDGPFRRPVGLARGELVDLDLGDGKKGKARVIRTGYAAEGRNRYGFPLTTITVVLPSGEERTQEVPEQELGRELGWFQAYVKDCRGWLDPQTVLPALVRGAGLPD